MLNDHTVSSSVDTANLKIPTFEGFSCFFIPDLICAIFCNDASCQMSTVQLQLHTHMMQQHTTHLFQVSMHA